MSKVEIYTTITNEVEELFATNKVSKEFKEALRALLDTHLKPMKAGSKSDNPSYVNEEGISMHFCRFHQVYEAEENMVMSKGKSKGYCKASIAKWTKIGKEIEKLESASTTALLADNIEQAKEFSAEAKKLREVRNDPTSFNYEEDWAAFNK